MSINKSEFKDKSIYWIFFAIFFLAIALSGIPILNSISTAVFFSMIPFYAGYYLNTNNERKLKRDQKKQKRIESAEEAENVRKIVQQIQQQETQGARDEAYRKRSELRKQIEEMPIYERWRQDVIKKCGNKCQICGSDKNLEVHHHTSFDSILKQYGITSKEQAFECKPLWKVDNGELLCKDCHDKMVSSKKRQMMSENNK